MSEGKSGDRARGLAESRCSAHPRDDGTKRQRAKTKQKTKDGQQPENCIVSEKGGNPRTAVQTHVYGVCSPDAE